MVFTGKFDPYSWILQRSKGRSLYFIDHGLLPGLIAAIAYASLMAFFGSESSPYLNAAAFAAITTPEGLECIRWGPAFLFSGSFTIFMGILMVISGGYQAWTEM